MWVRFEGQTKAVDSGGSEEEMRKRIQAAIGGAREEEMYVTSHGKKGDLRECGGNGIWKSN